MAHATSTSSIGALSGAEPSPDHIDLTDADMIVFNDYPNQITFTTDNNKNMSSEFPSSVDIKAGESAQGSVKAGNWPEQSYFDVHFASGDKMHLLLGSGLYKTNATPEVLPSQQGAIVLAPGQPFSTATDYKFWLFNGPDLIAQMINSAVQANLPAILSYIKTDGLTINIRDGVSLHLNEVNMDPSSAQCLYAAALPKPDSDTAWQLNAVVGIANATLIGTETLKFQTGSINLNVVNLKIYLQATVDLASKPPIVVTAFQTSLDDYTLTGGIVDILKREFPFWARVLAATAEAYRTAGLLNTLINGDIIDGINQAIANVIDTSKMPLILPPKIPGGALSFTSSLLSTAHTKNVSSSDLTSVPDMSTWMSNPTMQAKTLAQIKLPGTHDSATYNLSATLSQIQYSDIAFLWDINGDSAPVNGKWPIVIPPTPESPIYTGQTLQNFVLGPAVNSISRTQDLDIVSQLRAGIRYFDFRVYFDTRDDTFYIQHALRGPSFADILGQMREFLSANPTSTELIFAYVSHTNFKDNPDQIQAFADLINANIPTENLYYQSTPDGQQQFDFQILSATTLGSITNGSSKIMFLNGDWASYSFANTVTNTDGFAGVPYTGERYTVEVMTQQEAAGLSSHSEPLYSIGWSLGADTQAIITNILTLLTKVDKFVLQDLATAANNALAGFLDQNGGTAGKWNVVSVDWLECGPTPSVPEMVIAMNQ